MVQIIKGKKIITLIVLIAMTLLCCKSISPGNKTTAPVSTLMPDSNDVVIAKSHWVGVTLASLNQGYNLFSDKCSQCHGTKMPQDFSLEDWNNILPEMGRKAHLDSIQYNLVYRYILTKRETVMAGKK